MNSIAPFPETPEGIKAYQEIEPYPDWQELYSRFLLPEDRILNLYLEQDAPSNFTAFKAKIEAMARKRADAEFKRGTLLPWTKTRLLVYTRDGGVCDVCKQSVEWKYYECGHIVDRVTGGTDRLENLVVMCFVCNRLRKELHETKEDYIEWRDGRKWEQHEREIFNGLTFDEL